MRPLGGDPQFSPLLRVGGACVARGEQDESAAVARMLGGGQRRELRGAF